MCQKLHLRGNGLSRVTLAIFAAKSISSVVRPPPRPSLNWIPLIDETTSSVTDRRWALAAVSALADFFLREACFLRMASSWDRFFWDLDSSFSNFCWSTASDFFVAALLSFSLRLASFLSSFSALCGEKEHHIKKSISCQLLLNCTYVQDYSRNIWCNYLFSNDVLLEGDLLPLCFLCRQVFGHRIRYCRLVVVVAVVFLLTMKIKSSCDKFKVRYGKNMENIKY